MRKLLFFDNQAVQTLSNMTRVLHKPVKYSDNPLFTADLPWETGNLTLYGSVIKVKDQPFQIWYSIIDEKWRFYLSYAESDDGIYWQRPELGLDDAGLPLPGLDLEHSCPITGDNGCARLTWQSEHGLMVAAPADQQIRLQLELSSATLYTISQQVDGENDRYDRFAAW